MTTPSGLGKHKIVAFAAVIDLHADQIFLELRAAAFQGLLDDEAQKPALPSRIGEGLSSQDFFQLGPYRGGGDIGSARWYWLRGRQKATLKTIGGMASIIKRRASAVCSLPIPPIAPAQRLVVSSLH